MKRILSILMIALMAISLASCDWFKKNEQPKEATTVESYIESDMDYMVENYGESYAWYETEYLLTFFFCRVFDKNRFHPQYATPST